MSNASKQDHEPQNTLVGNVKRTNVRWYVFIAMLVLDSEKFFSKNI